MVSLGQRIVRRIRAATNTNEPQVLVVLWMTGLSLFAFVQRDTHPLWLGYACLVMWPIIGFLANLVSPLPGEARKRTGDSPYNP